MDTMMRQSYEKKYYLRLFERWWKIVNITHCGIIVAREPINLMMIFSQPWLFKEFFWDASSFILDNIVNIPL